MSNLIAYQFKNSSIRIELKNNEPLFCLNDIRVFQIDNQIWFCADDVVKSLDLKNTSMALKPLDNDERSKLNLGRQGEVNIINESGLYCLIMRSREAVKQGTIQHSFRKWVTSEVLPSIRKTGSYSLTLNKQQIKLTLSVF
jgi:prophage antirepressor-like protein